MLFAVVALCAVSASAAFGAEVPQYLVEGKTIALGETIEPTLETEAGEAGWALVEDMNASAAGDPDLLCEVVETKNLLLSNGEGEVPSGKCAKIAVDSGTCGSPKLGPVNLPWTTKLLEPAAGEFEGEIKAAGEGPGWAAECTVLGVKVTDTCVTQHAKFLVLVETGLLHIEFMEVLAKNEEAANCSVGGKEEGLVNWLFWEHFFINGVLDNIEVALAEEVS